MTDTRTKGQKVISFIALLAGLLAGMSAIITFVIWLLYPHISTSILKIVNDNKETTLRSDLAVKLDLDEEEVDNKIEWMYNTVLDLSIMDHGEGDDNKFAEYLDKEIQWRAIGFYVSVADKGIIKYRHQNGRDYDAWIETETGRLYYIRDGYKYY